MLGDFHVTTVFLGEYIHYFVHTLHQNWEFIPFFLKKFSSTEMKCRGYGKERHSLPTRQNLHHLTEEREVIVFINYKRITFESLWSSVRNLDLCSTCFSSISRSFSSARKGNVPRMLYPGGVFRLN